MSIRAFLTVIAACVFVSGCAAPPVSGDVSQPTASVGYTLRVLEGATPAVRVTMRVVGEEDGTSRLAIAPEWGGIQNCERFVHGLSVRDEQGQACVVSADTAAHGWDVQHAPGATLVATYELRPGGADPFAGFGTHYEPVVRDDLFHLIGETGLVYPEWLEGAGPIEIRFAWEGTDARGWTPVTSFDGEKGTIRGTMQEFRHGIFIAGRVRIHDRDIRGGRLRVAVYGEDWGFTDEEMVELVERVVAIEREFVNDFADPYFLVTVVPTGPKASPGGFSLGGTGLTNCFALFLAPGTTAGPGTPHRSQILHLLAHEYFHTWNGGEISLEQPEELAYWFSEGFTDFYAARLLVRGGLMEEAAWVERLNGTLKKLWLSPVATAPAATIKAEFWSRREVQELPYNRGEVVALMLDEEIRRVSSGTKSLDDLFLELLADSRAGAKVETEMLLARIARWTSQGFADSIRRTVVDGAMPQPPERLTSVRAMRTEVESFQYDAGFDVDETMRTRVVTGVREGSVAHGAGLRDGQTMAGLSINRGDPDKEASVTVLVDGVRRPMTFYPRTGAGVRIPAYVVEGATR